MAERFINEHPCVDVSPLKLYFVTAELPIEPTPPEDALRCTALWRGYIGTWRLNANGTLELLGFTFPHFDDGKNLTQEFPPAKADGNFTLTFRPFFQGPNTKVPFENGHVIEDRKKWQIDDQTLDAQAYEAYGDAGLLVRIVGGTGFIPKSMLLAPSRKLETMVGQRFRCEFVGRDEDRRAWILREVEPENRG